MTSDLLGFFEQIYFRSSCLTVHVCLTLEVHEMLSLFASIAKTQFSVVPMSCPWKMRKLGALSPVRLVYQSIDSINALISMQIVEHGFSKTLLNFKPSLSQLPRELQTLLLKSAEKSLDQVYTVRTLLLIWMACVENGNIKEILTPRYLYNDEDGRKFILSKLGQFGQLSTDKVDKLSFFMYSFYNHGKAGSKGFEFTLKGENRRKRRNDILSKNESRLSPSSKPK